MDRAALAGGVAALEQRHEALSGLLLPELNLDEFDLEFLQRREIFLLVELLLVGVVVGGEGLVVDPFRQLGIVDVEDAALAADLQLHCAAFCLFRRLR